jgi:hypothetical protein
MPGTKTEGKTSHRLLSIDWGQKDSTRNPKVNQQRDLTGRQVCVRIDEVFHHINAYRALVDADAGEGLLARSLISQANAIFNQAFVNLEARHKFSKVYVDGPVGGREGVEDITDLVIEEVLAMQNILED